MPILKQTLAEMGLTPVINVWLPIIQFHIQDVLLVKDVFPNTKDGFSDLVMEVACALHNLIVECRPVQIPCFHCASWRLLLITNLSGVTQYL
ncbi:MAG: hypothetical protein WBL25_00795, partial [Anaerolineales bacterium]